MKMLTRIYLIIAILIASIGLVQFVRYSGFPIEGRFRVLLLSIVPALAFLAMFGSRKYVSNKIYLFAAIPIGFLVFSFWALATLGIEILHHATSDVTNPRKYEKVLKEHWNYPQKLVAHFPPSIPTDAQNVRFSFRPVFLQGGAHIQLRYSASPEIIDELYERLSVQKTKSYYGGQSSEHMNMEGGMPTTIFYTSGSENFEFPDDYEIMIFDELVTQNGGYWNHGKSHGVAISRQRNEIVYWAEHW